MWINSILTKLIFLIAVVEFLIMVFLYEFFEPLHTMLEKYIFLGPIIDTFILVLIITIAYFKMLKRPLGKLLKVMDAVEKKDFSIKADEKRKDELGAIASHFNRVSERLKNWGNDLEIQVEEQTRQFKEMNKELIMANEELHTSTSNLNRANEGLTKLKSELERKAEERAAELTKAKEELEKKIFELEQSNRVLVEREREMEDLKVKIAALEGHGRSSTQRPL